MAEAQTMWLCRCGYLNPGRKPTCGDCGQFRDRGPTHTQNKGNEHG
jgi:hypothetical protein